MKRLFLSVTVLTLVFLSFQGCDKGLTPDPSGFTGVIRFTNWPPPDSVQELRLVAFKSPPTDSSGLLVEFLKGNVVIYPPVGTPAFTKFKDNGDFIDSIKYTVILQNLPAGEATRYTYVALAWRYGPNVFADWAPAGVYSLQPSTHVPATLVVEKHNVVRDVNILCDFRNLPPKPWR